MPNRDPNKIYENQINPLVQKLLSRCKHYDLPLMVAISVPLTDATGVTMVQMQPDATGCVPNEFLAAFRLIEKPAQDVASGEAPVTA